jgi:mannan endo-1,4-beta-mannosidase
MYPHVALLQPHARNPRSDKRYALLFALLMAMLIAPGAFAQQSAQLVNPTVGGGGCGFTLAPLPAAVMLPRGGTVTVTIDLSCLQPNGPVSLGLAGVPVGVVASFGSLTTDSATLTLSASNTAPLGTFTLTVTATSGGLTASTTIVVTITDGGVEGDTTCHIGYDIVSEWGGMFEAVLSIDNTRTVPIPPGWILTWSFANGQTVSQLWNATVMQTATNVTVQGASNIPAGGSDKGVGFLATKITNVPNQVPTAFSLNGVPCFVN